MKHFAKTSLALAIGFACVPAIAQQVLSQTAPSEEDVEHIYVTGQKLANTIQDTKESVAVFTNDMLEDQNLTDLTDVFLLTPGVSGNQFGYRIRGVRNSDGSSQPNRADLASTVIDGVTLSGWVKSEGAGQLWDVAQVEVLRGPQSTNLGRNALAGAVVVNTMDPKFVNEGVIRLGAGEYGMQEIRGVANFNIVDDVSAVRIAIEQNESDGYINNITRNEDDYGHSSNDVYRLKWLFQPTDNLKSVLSYQRIESKYGSTSTYFIDGYSREDRVTPADGDAIFDTDADLLSLNVDYDINDYWSMKSITAYQSGERVRFNDADNTSLSVENGGGIVSRFSEDNNWSQELRFNYQGDGVRGSSGVFLSGIEAKRSQMNTINYNLPVLFDDFIPGLGVVLTTDLVLPVALYQQLFDTVQSGRTDVDTSIWAVFTEWEFDLGDNWIINAGLRYDNETQDYSTESSTVSNYDLPAMGGPFGAVDLGGVTIDQAIFLINSQLAGLVTGVPLTESSEDFSNLLPHAGITYLWNDDVSTSFFVKKSYRSGGTELTLLNGINTFEAEELWNYEASLRAVVLDGKGVFNANVYYSDWTDQQVAVQEPGTTNAAFTMTVNAGESTLSGAEVSFNYDITNNLKLYTGVAISHTEYDEFDSASGNFEGQSFTFAPEETAVIGITYVGDTGFFANANIAYTGDSVANLVDNNDPNYDENIRSMNGYTLVNVNGGYEFDNFKIEAYVRNLTDKLYDTNTNIMSTDGVRGTRLGAPREVGARVTYSF